MWNGLSGGFDAGYADLACAVNYATSHDVQARAMMNVILGPMLESMGLGDGGVDNVMSTVDNPLNSTAADAVCGGAGALCSAYLR